MCASEGWAVVAVIFFEQLYPVSSTFGLNRGRHFVIIIKMVAKKRGGNFFSSLIGGLGKVFSPIVSGIGNVVSGLIGGGKKKVQQVAQQAVNTVAQSAQNAI